MEPSAARISLNGTKALRPSPISTSSPAMPAPAVVSPTTVARPARWRPNAKPSAAEAVPAFTAMYTLASGNLGPGT